MSKMKLLSPSLNEDASCTKNGICSKLPSTMTQNRLCFSYKVHFPFLQVSKLNENMSKSEKSKQCAAAFPQRLAMLFGV